MNQKLLAHTRDYTAEKISNMSATAIAKLWKHVPDPTNLFDYAVRIAICKALDSHNPKSYHAWLISNIDDPTDFF